MLVAAAPGVSTLAEKTNNFLIPNATFIAELIAFVVMFGLLGKYVLPHITKAMNDRQEMIRRQIDDTREAKERLEAAEAQVRAALAETRAEAQQVLEEAKQQGQKLIDEKRGQAEVEAERVGVRSRAQLEAERQQILGQLRAEIGGLAVDLAGRIVGAQLADDAVQQRLVDEFIGGLDGGVAAETPAPSPAGGAG